MHVSWGYFKPIEEFSWLSFVSALRKSLNTEIVSSCNQVVRKLEHNFHCVHIREESDFTMGSLSMIDFLEKANNSKTLKYYVTTRNPLKQQIQNPKVFTRFDFGNYGFLTNKIIPIIYLCKYVCMYVFTQIFLKFQHLLILYCICIYIQYIKITAYKKLFFSNES